MANINIGGITVFNEANSGLAGSTTTPVAINDVVLVRLGSIQGTSAGAESVAFENGKIYASNVNGNTINIHQLAADGTLTNLAPINLTTLPDYKTGGVNSVAINNGVLAVAYENITAGAGGYVALFDTTTNTLIKTISVGVLPDQITFTPDGTKLLVANEAEAISVTNNPVGSISIIDMSSGAAHAAVVNTISFDALNGSEAALKAQGLALLNGQSAAADIEPEYITVSADGTRAYVTLQEVNAVAVVDLTNPMADRPLSILPLGTVDRNLLGNSFDASDRDGTSGSAAVNLQNYDVQSLLQPDAIASFSVAGVTYFVTANEGDSRVGTSITDSVRLNSASYVLDATAYPNAAALKADAKLGRLNVLTHMGDTDGDGDYDQIYTLGGRSITIFRQEADGSISKVRETGGEFEAITSALGTSFNANQSTAANSFDTRSDDKGPEPEGVTVGEVNGRLYAFVGLERIGGFMIYDVTDPVNATFVGYKAQTANDLGPEVQKFIAASQSPTGQALLVSGNEISNSVTVYAIQTQSEGNDVIMGGSDAEVWSGRGGNDTINGGDGADTLIGGAGNDSFIGGGGNDVIMGNEGDDSVAAYNLSTDGVDQINLGSGMDTLNVSSTGASQICVMFTSAEVGNNNANDAGTLANQDGGLAVRIQAEDGSGNLVGNIGRADDEGITIVAGAGITLDVRDLVSGVGRGDQFQAATLGTNVADTIDESSESINYYVNAGQGDDIVMGGSGNDFLVGGAGADQLTGNMGNDSFIGGGGNDVIMGNEGDDNIDGGADADLMSGGLGNDVYTVDNIADQVFEQISQGTDTIQASVNYTLMGYVENLTLIGANSINGTGNSLNNMLTGNNANNILNGAKGSDTLLGGLGNDTYMVDSIGDVVTELAEQGIDTVQATISYTLVGQVENLELVGVSNLKGTGNDLNNQLLGNAGNNVLTAGLGADTLNGGMGADTLYGGLGDDSYIVNSSDDVVKEFSNQGLDTVHSSIDYTLIGHVENLLLTGTAAINGTGNSLNNMLTGNSANNILDGAKGNDTLLGGLGNDTYIIDNIGDVVTELSNEGIDTIRSIINQYGLAAHVENLELMGGSHLTGIGNGLDNSLTGNSGNNQLKGELGADTLNGGVGNDTLTGGLGNDVYQFGRDYQIDTLVEADGTVGNTDIVAFMGGIAVDQLWFKRVGNNLEVSIIGTSDKVVVKSWYLSTDNQVEQFKTTDGNMTLLSTDVQALVNAMASIAPPSLGQTELSSEQHSQLDVIIAASWS